MQEGKATLSALAIYETLYISAPTVVDAFLGTVSRKVCDARLDGWACRLMNLAEVDIRVDGKEHVEQLDKETVVIVSNHESLYDIPAIFFALPGRSVRMTTKAELFRVPVWGPAMRAAGFPEIDRKNPARAIETLKRARALLDSGIDVWFAPEGTRSRTGKLGEFKKGAFHFAHATERRILPVGIKGTADVIHPNGVLVNPGKRVDVRFGTPIDTREFGDDIDRLTLHTRGVIEGLIAA